MKSVILSKHAPDIYFLMKYCLLGMASFESEYKNAYIKLGKEYFDILSADDVTEERLRQFEIKKFEVLDSVLQVHHEFSDDDEKLILERKLITWEYNRIQKHDNNSEKEKTIAMNTVSEEEFFNEQL